MIITALKKKESFSKLKKKKLNTIEIESKLFTVCFLILAHVQQINCICVTLFLFFLFIFELNLLGITIITGNNIFEGKMYRFV